MINYFIKNKYAYLFVENYLYNQRLSACVEQGSYLSFFLPLKSVKTVFLNFIL